MRPIFLIMSAADLNKQVMERRKMKENELVTKNLIKFVFGAFCLVFALSTQADGVDKVTIAPTEQTHAMISAGSVLQHNKHLLDNTTIGKDLKTSPTQRVKNLYKMAYNFFIEATDAHKSGQERKAKELAHKSINIFYAADKAHYNLAKHY